MGCEPVRSVTLNLVTEVGSTVSLSALSFAVQPVHKHRVNELSPMGNLDDKARSLDLPAWIG